jgi:hypothetical protein
MEKDRFFFDAIVEDSSQLGFDFSYQVHGVGRVGPVRILAGQSGPLPIVSDREERDLPL